MNASIWIDPLVYNPEYILSIFMKAVVTDFIICIKNDEHSACHGTAEADGIDG
jgi:hypothetical protein